MMEWKAEMDTGTMQTLTPPDPLNLLLKTFSHNRSTLHCTECLPFFLFVNLFIYFFLFFPLSLLSAVPFENTLCWCWRRESHVAMFVNFENGQLKKRDSNTACLHTDDGAHPVSANMHRKHFIHAVNTFEQQTAAEFTHDNISKVWKEFMWRQMCYWRILDVEIKLLEIISWIHIALHWRCGAQIFNNCFSWALYVKSKKMSVSWMNTSARMLIWTWVQSTCYGSYYTQKIKIICSHSTISCFLGWWLKLMI